ncbi:hypothetical protein ABPG75_012021 [Micractinium tetrahymenae]
MRPPTTCEIQQQGACVSTPVEYVEAFEKQQPRCVSPDLFGRISNGRNAAAAALSDDALSGRLANFWSGQDVLEKYLRFGYPEIIGASTATNDSGLDSDSSGLTFLQQVCQSCALPSCACPAVWTAPALPCSPPRAALTSHALRSLPYGGGIPTLAPTWTALADYFAYVFSSDNLEVSNASIAILDEEFFGELTGCTPECAYKWRRFPEGNRTTALYTQPRWDNGTCPPPQRGSQRTEPTAFEETSKLCDQEWQDALNATQGLFPVRSCTFDQNAAAGRGLAQLLREAQGDARKQALLFRAFLIQYCPGNFNTIFSGNGFTYTGVSGMLSPLGTEFISSPLLVSAWPDGEHAAIPFCISGTNGGRPTSDGVCEMPV